MTITLKPVLTFTVLAASVAATAVVSDLPPWMVNLTSFASWVYTSALFVGAFITDRQMDKAKAGDAKAIEWVQKEKDRAAGPLMMKANRLAVIGFIAALAAAGSFVAAILAGIGLIYMVAVGRDLRAFTSEAANG